MSEPSWELLLLSEVLREGLYSVRAKRFDYTIEHVRHAGALTTAAESNNRFRVRWAEFDRINRSLVELFAPKTQVWMLGEPGQDGDRDRILHVGSRFVEAYEQLLDWAADLRGTAVHDTYTALYQATARMARRPLEQIEEFVDHFDKAVRGGAELPKLILDPDLSEVEPALRQLGISTPWTASS